MKNKIAVIGAGPSGLVAAQELAATGLTPVAFDQCQEIGGLWRANGGAVWPTMRCNLSKYSCVFSSYPWQADSTMFPSAVEMNGYLHYFARSHLGSVEFRLDSPVGFVEPGNGQ